MEPARLPVSFPMVSSSSSFVPMILAPGHQTTGRSRTCDAMVARVICEQGSSRLERGGKLGRSLNFESVGPEGFQGAMEQWIDALVGKSHRIMTLRGMVWNLWNF